MNNQIKSSRKILPCIFRKFEILTRSPNLKVLIPLLLLCLQFGIPLYVIAINPGPVIEKESDTYYLDQINELVVIKGSNSFSAADTVILNKHITRIFYPSAGSGMVTFQNNQNYLDPVSGLYLKRDLNPRSKQIIDAHIDTFDYEVKDDLDRKFNKKLTKYSVTDPDGNILEYNLLGVGNVQSEAVINENRARVSITDDYDIDLYNTPEGIKEEIILYNANAPVQFRYRIQTNLQINKDGNSLRFEDSFVSRIFAYDATGDDVPLTLDLSGNVLTIDIDNSTAVYPITIDPTVEWQHGDSFGFVNTIQGDGANVVENAGARINALWRITDPRRPIVKFDSIETIIPDHSIINRASFGITSNTSAAQSDSVIGIYALLIPSTEGTGDLSAGVANWDTASTGVPWTSPGGDFDSTGALVRTIGNIANNDTVIFDITAIVQRWVNQEIDNNGVIMKFISDGVSDNNQEYNFDSDDATTPGDRPILEIDYTALPAGTPHGLALSGHLYNQLIITAKDTGGVLTDRFVFYDSVNNVTGDTIFASGANDSILTDTLNYTNQYDSLTSIKILSVDTLNRVEISTMLQVYTLAQRLPVGTISDTTDSTIQIAFPATADSNPSRVFYRLEDLENDVFVDLSGDTSASDSAWYISSSIDTISVKASPNYLRRLAINSRNSDSVAVDDFIDLEYDSTWVWAEIPDILSAFPHNRDSILVVIDPKANPSFTYFAIEDSVSGLFIDNSSNVFRSPGVTVDSSWAWASFAEWGGSAGYYVIVSPNTSFVFRAYAKEGRKRD